MKSQSRSQSEGKRSDSAANDLDVAVSPWGPQPDELNALTQSVIRHPSVQQFLGDAQYRVLSVDLVEPEPAAKPRRIPAPPKRYRATIYDYTNNRTIRVDGRLGDPERVEVSESALQPLPSPEEFEAAVDALLHERGIGPAIREGRLQPYPPMPPLILNELPDGSTERTIAVGLLPERGDVPHEIVGVNPLTRQVFHRLVKPGRNDPGGWGQCRTLIPVLLRACQDNPRHRIGYGKSLRRGYLYPTTGGATGQRVAGGLVWTGAMNEYERSEHILHACRDAASNAACRAQVRREGALRRTVE